VLVSEEVIKAGVGLPNDISVLWNDTRIDLMNMVDAGLMAKLWMCRKYSESSYSNLSMLISAAEVLKLYVDKEQRVSNWKEPLSEEQIMCG
jgi:ribonuclease D